MPWSVRAYAPLIFHRSVLKMFGVITCNIPEGEGAERTGSVIHRRADNRGRMMHPYGGVWQCAAHLGVPAFAVLLLDVLDLILQGLGSHPVGVFGICLLGA